MVNYQIIPIEVLSTDHGYNCAYTITQGDTNAYILKITYTDITEFDGTVTLRFTFPDGTYADRENVVIDGNTITYTMDETDYSQRNVSVFVRHADSTIIHTTLKIKFSNIRALPGNSPTTEIKSYPEWASDMIDYDITVGTVETLAPGTDATASVTGDVPDKILNLGIPQGDVGPQGIPGEVQLSDLTATNIDYIDTNSTLGDATDVQAALDSAGEQLSAIDTQLAEKALKTEVGTLANLLTTAKTTIVAAINELFNSKANKVHEDWITPTLLNGWTGTLKYRKNSIGQLEFRGNASGGSTGNIMVMGDAYKPKTIKEIISRRDYITMFGITIYINASVVISTSNYASTHNFDGVVVPID